MPKDFWCELCQRWTAPDVDHPTSGPTCSNCGEPYGCGECGFEIDENGICQRSAAGAGECLGEVEVRGG